MNELTEVELDALLYDAGETRIDNVPTLPREQDAQRAARSIARIAKARDRELGRIRSEIERLEALHADRDAIHAAALAEHHQTIEGWHRGNPDERTFRTGYGDSTLRAATVKAEVQDDLAVVEWAESNGLDQLVKFDVDDRKAAIAFAIANGYPPIKSVDTVKLRGMCKQIIKAKLGEDGAVADAVTDDGEPVPGVQLVRPQPTWNYTPNYKPEED